MIGAVPNPKKTITIDFPISKLKETIGFIPLTKDKAYKFTSKNEVFNLYTFEATEFLSLGVYVDISFSEVSENKTTIEIEVRRKIGAFDQAHEVTSANNHISKIIELISLCVSLTDEKIESLKKSTTTEQVQLNGFKSKEVNTQNYNCGVCKNVFYADINKSTIWTCPHCKTPNLLKKEVSTQSLIIFVVVALVALGLVMLMINSN
jgi:DNA-directed RNA polymerase subunit RPC12/RpoP